MGIIVGNFHDLRVRLWSHTYTSGRDGLGRTQLVADLSREYFRRTHVLGKRIKCAPRSLAGSCRFRDRPWHARIHINGGGG
jgi:hypothetical protein